MKNRLFIPLFLRKTDKIEDFSWTAAILDECQIYLGGGERLIKMTVINGKSRYISMIWRINSGLYVNILHEKEKHAIQKKV